MNHQTRPTRDPDARRYEIRLTGHLGARWAAWFDGLTVRHDGDDTTVISGSVADQAALHGLLQRVRDLGLPLVSLTRVEHDDLNDRPPSTEGMKHDDPTTDHRPRPRDRRHDQRQLSERTNP